MDCVFGVVSKKASSDPRFYPMLLSPRSFIVLHFTFRSVICLELISLKGVRSVPRFFFSHVDVHLFQDHLLHCIAFAPLSDSHVGLVLGSVLCSID